MTKSNPIKLEIAPREKKLLLLQSPQYQTSDIDSAISNYEEAINTEGWEVIKYKLRDTEASSWQTIRNIILDTYSTEHHLANLIVGEDIDYVPRREQLYWDLGYRGDYPLITPYDFLGEIPDFECWAFEPYLHEIDIPTGVIIPSTYDNLETRRLQIQEVFNKFAIRSWDYGELVTSFSAPDIGSDYYQCHLKQLMPILGTHENSWSPTKEDLASLAIKQRKMVDLEAHSMYSRMNICWGGYSATEFQQIKTPLAFITGCMTCGWKPMDTTTKCTIDPPYNPADYFGYAILINPDLRLACLGYIHWAFHGHEKCEPVPHTEECIIDDSSPCIYWTGILDILPELAAGKSFAEALSKKEIQNEYIFHGDPTFKYPD